MRKLTVVLNVEDPGQLRALYDSHMGHGLIAGCRPSIISNGDQITIPGEIVTGMAQLDPGFPDKKELAELVDMAEKHLKGEVTGESNLKPLSSPHG